MNDDGLTVDDTPAQMWAETLYRLRDVRAGWLVHLRLLRALLTGGWRA